MDSLIIPGGWSFLTKGAKVSLLVFFYMKSIWKKAMRMIALDFLFAQNEIYVLKIFD